MGLRSPESHPNRPRVGTTHLPLAHRIPNQDASPIPSHTTTFARNCTIHSYSQEYTIQRRCISLHAAIVPSAATTPAAEITIDTPSPSPYPSTRNPPSIIVSGPIHRPISPQAPSILTHFHHSSPPAKSTPQPDAPGPPSIRTPAATTRPQDPITFTEFYRQRTLAHLFQDVNLEPHHDPVTDLMDFLKYMVDWIRPAVHAALDAMKRVGFSITLLFRYTHSAKELQDRHTQYVNTGKRHLMKQLELQEMMEAMVGTMLLRN